MKAPYGERLVIHTDLDSCGATREGGVEALKEARAGQMCSRERTSLQSADAVRRSERRHPEHRYCQM
jgi:hypothetical protein